MTRRLLSAAVLLAATASAASAQTQVTFRQSSSSGYNGTYGMITSNNASSVPGGGFTKNSAFQVWCVDQNHNSSTSSYDAYVSRLDGDLSKTRVNNQVTYQKAAYLANGMGSSGSNGQYAIWAVIHGKSNSATWYGGNTLCDNNPIFPIGGLSGCNGSTVNALMTAAGYDYGTMSTSEWYVISDKKADSWMYDGKQEFIARCQGGTPGACDGFTPPNAAEDPTPEPATMSLLAMGLAGMAGTSLRRRKQK